ncbi:hypothetical protein C2857_005181 [Epichloe festucae Fl1]|uniref:Uncharacterized protein n=1 Tax=Epichloe festucae (strain Fl1) TaxID=877507 RepID=A0A7U3Q3Z3_EPIFF|nr:hypothetical protein C2857_005181 [Epichloe festucae Fl1]
MYPWSDGGQVHLNNTWNHNHNDPLQQLQQDYRLHIEPPHFPPPPPAQDSQIRRRPSSRRVLHRQHHADTHHEHERWSWGVLFKSMLSAGAAAPINRLAPTKQEVEASCRKPSCHQECDKAAAIPRSFRGTPRKGRVSTLIPALANLQPEKRGNPRVGLIDPTRQRPENRVIFAIPPKVISL